MKQIQSGCILSLVVLFFPSTANGQIQDSNSVDENALLRFQQQKVSANMRELEDRMMRLAALIRNQNPDDSARLLLGVENARESLILEQMNEVDKMLSEFQLSDASTEQREVLEKLNALRRILLDSEIGVDVKIEQLRNLADARNRLAHLLTREVAQRAQTLNAKTQSITFAKNLAEREWQNFQLGQKLHQNLIRLAAPADSTIAMAQANLSLRDATRAINAKNWRSAEERQLHAIEKMKNVDQQLIGAQQELQASAESATKQRVAELISRAFDLQTGLKNATIAQLDKQSDLLNVLRPLATEQKNIMALVSQCIEVSVLAEFSFVLPEALREIRQQMEAVRLMFRHPEVGMEFVRKQELILADLESLLGAIQQASQSGSPKVKNNKLNCCSDRNEILAEVKMLSWMQSQVSRKTRRLRGQKLEEATTDPRENNELAGILKQQNKIIEITERIRTISMQGFIEEGAPK